MKEEAKDVKDQLVHGVKEEYGELVEFLARERDELRVSMHLASADAQDQWREVEKKLEHLESRVAAVGKVTEVSAKEVGAATKLLGEEIKDAYKRIRNSLS
jgi:hypothetical protein